jgi:hypothetical protein
MSKVVTKERPILMAGEMVRAVLAGRKTVTRRLAKGVCGDSAETWPYWPGGVHGGDFVRPEHCPIAQVGDRLWVRESYCPNYFDGGGHAYMADWTGEVADVVPVPKWTPSIHMPRSAARIFLDVTSVRVERLHDITDDDAMAEGIQRFSGNHGECRFGSRDLSDRDRHRSWNDLPRSPIAAFQSLWDSLATGDTRWCNNPWIWRVEFSDAATPTITT